MTGPKPKLQPAPRSSTATRESPITRAFAGTMPDIQRASADNTNQNQARAWDVGVARPMQAAPPRVPTDRELYDRIPHPGQSFQSDIDMIRMFQNSDWANWLPNGVRVSGDSATAQTAAAGTARSAFLRQVVPGYGMTQRAGINSSEADAQRLITRMRQVTRAQVRGYSDFLNRVEGTSGQELDSAATRLNSLRRLWTGLDRHTPVYLP